MKRVLACAAAAAASLTVAAQERRALTVPDGQRFEVAVPSPGVAGAMTNTFVFMSAEAGLSEKFVKGAPYSATAVTETVQTLADGNRITHASKASLARDSQGRTRREQSFPALGPWASEGAAPRTTTISDPAAGVTYMLDEQSRTARKLEEKGLVRAKMAKAEAMGVATNMEGKVHVVAGAATAAGPEQVMMLKRSASWTQGSAIGGEPKTEQLGQKTMEGVVADGTRTTIEIPAGAVGNERPIQIIDERWYSQELQTTVMSRHSDPRGGETTFRLTNISRAEPSALLFEVPSDYKLVEASGPIGFRVQEDKE